MSSISGVTSSTKLYQRTNDFSKRFRDFKALGAALQSGDVSSAKSALANFQQAVSGNSAKAASQPFGKNSQANADFQTLTSALQSGDMTGAQQAFASLQSDLKTASKGHRHHHQDQDAGDNSGTSASGSASITSAFSTIASLTSSSALANPATDSDGDHDGSSLNVTA